MYTINIDNNPGDEVVAALSAGLRAHSQLHTPAPGFLPIASVLRDENGKIKGGMWGYVNWNWLSINLVWLSEDLRGGGYGKKLLLALESEARARGCQLAHLDTFSYQARPFYEKMGYEVFATLENYPPDHQRFFMKKTLS